MPVEVGIEALHHLRRSANQSRRATAPFCVGMKPSNAAMPIATPIAARKPNIPIGWTKPTAIVTRLIIPIATPTRPDAAHEVGIDALPFTTGGLADRTVAVVELPHDAVALVL